MSLGENLSPGVKLILAAGLLLLIIFAIGLTYNFLAPSSESSEISLALSEPSNIRDSENNIKIVEISAESKETLYIDEIAAIISNENMKEEKIGGNGSTVTISTKKKAIVLSHYNPENNTLTSPTVKSIWIIEKSDENTSNLDTPKKSVLKKKKSNSVREYLELPENAKEAHLSIFHYPTDKLILKKTIKIN